MPRKTPQKQSKPDHDRPGIELDDEIGESPRAPRRPARTARTENSSEMARELEKRLAARSMLGWTPDIERASVMLAEARTEADIEAVRDFVRNIDRSEATL